MKTIREIDLKEKRVLVRCDFNCPLDEKGNILEDWRIEATLPTIEYLIKNKARVILMSHLGRPEGKKIKKFNLNVIQNRLFEYLDLSILKAPDCIGENIEKMTKELSNGEVLLLENLRFHKEEEENDKNFAKKLASLGDIFVQDAFGACHNVHASIVGIPNYLPACAGFLLKKEVENLTKILKNFKRPLVIILGGVKIETKLPVIKNFLTISDFILIGGKLSEEIEKTKISHPKLYAAKRVKDYEDLIKDDIDKFKEIISKAKTIFWNGPLGYFEKKEFEKGTKEIALTIAKSNAFKVAGGGETILAILKYNLKKKFNFISTGGGAMLNFLAGKKLPGIEAIK